ncbi:hypothetical protein HYE67_011354 [Fusarium culmorum]|uniref:Uncharacterized protein n=1 Tax=Fusarium culmorum TaxID=5516 RepID=A0A7S8DIA8_FUSCU|nr:hypothetical protein HYE67_011354 [Fusarium culmorum]
MSMESYRDSRQEPQMDYTTMMLKNISDSLVVNRTEGNWEKMAFADCMERYNHPERDLTHYQHAIFVMYGYDGRDLISLSVFSGTTIHRTDVQPFSLTTKSWEPETSHVSGKWISGTWDFEDTQNVFDNVSGLFVTDPRHFTEKHQVLQVDHCLSERFIAPCQVNIFNSLLLIACVMCTLKSVLCLLVLQLRDNENPLITPGDAIASFGVKSSMLQSRVFTQWHQFTCEIRLQ